MEKKYKVISDFGLNAVYIENFETLEEATRIFNQSIKCEAAYVYLLETCMTFSSGDSCEDVLSFFKR